MPANGSLMMSNPEDSCHEHVLLTVLGTSSQSASYTLGARQFRSTLAPVALLELLPEASRPRRLFAICTPEAAEKTWPALVDELKSRNEECAPERIDVPSGSDQADMVDFLHKVADTIAGNRELTVDVTHGFRHYSFLTYVAVQYLTALRGVQVHGAYYGMLGQGPDGTSPFLDLRPLLELPRWTHALEVLRDTGSALPIARAIRKAPTSDTTARVPQSSRQRIEKSLSRCSEDYLSGLPLELGRESKLFRVQNHRPFNRLLNCDLRIPLADNLVKWLDNILAGFALTTQPAGAGWKGRVGLSDKELERQAGMIDELLEHGHIAAALGLMNEWTVSWAILRHYGEEKSHWLDYWKLRHKAAGALNAIRAINADPKLKHILTDEQGALGGFWTDLTDLRNGYHHHGMRRQPLVGDRKADTQFCRVREYWLETLRLCPDFRLSIGESTGRRVLVSPIGMRPGVLFSALHACREAEREPGICLVLCSDETEGKIADAVDHSNFIGTIKPLVLEDPFGGGRPEIDRLTKEAREEFIGADTVLVNVTGGTTLMGLAAEAIASVARSLACSVRRFGLIDRRPPAYQEADPYQVGEPFWLDKEGDGRSDQHRSQV